MLSINTWGNYVWIFFHTFANIIGEQKFIKHKSNILELIRIVCNNLPCPECVNDATKYLAYFNLEQNINSKSDLKKFFHYFHNVINIKLKKPQFDINKLDEQYSNLEFNSIYKNFMKVFTIKINGPPNMMMMHNFKRHRSVDKIQSILLSIMN